MVRIIILLVYYDVMRPLSYMGSVVEWNVVSGALLNIPYFFKLLSLTWTQKCMTRDHLTSTVFIYFGKYTIHGDLCKKVFK
jgi:hypothetical protein